MSDRIDQSGPYDASVGAIRYTAVPAESEPVVVSDDAEETAELRGDIAQTQAEMSETVNAIGERLSPQRLMDQAKDTVREATVGKAEQVVTSAGETARGAGSTITQTIRANPVPAAMAAIGLGWLIRKGSQSSSGRRPLDRSRRAAASTTSNVQDKAGQMASQAQDKAGQLVGQAQSQVSQLGDQAQDQAQALVGQTQYHAQRAQRGVQRLLQENPLAVGAAAVAAGAAVGLAIPGTRRENQLMGEARDNLMGKAQASAQETMHKVQRVAQEAQSAAQAAAQDQGLAG
jgi:hypothetical protein